MVEVSALGRIKDYYHDELTIRLQRWVSVVSFACPICAHPFHEEVQVPEPNYAGENLSEMVSEGEVELHCKACGNYFGGDVWAGPAHCDINLRDYPGTEVSCDLPGYDRPPEDWDDWQIADDPFTVFRENRTELSHLIDTQSKAAGSSLINRMIFAQILTFLEAYFCDTLISGLRKRPDLLANFARRDGSVSDIEFKAYDVLRDPDHVRKTVEHNLKSRLYHQFGSGKTDGKGNVKPQGVALWYAMAFGFRLTASDDDLESLREYAALRHDCVHRNGKTKDGETLDVFKKKYLIDALALAERVVNHIEASMKAVPAPKKELF